MATFLFRRSRTLLLHNHQHLQTKLPFFINHYSNSHILPSSSSSPFLVSSSRYESTKAQTQLKDLHHHVDDDQVLDFPGGKVGFTSEMRFISDTSSIRVPCYRVLDDDGELMKHTNHVQVSKELAVRMHSEMVTLQTMDSIFYELQRQGRISFYLTTSGEEAVNIASAAALSSHDVILPQYREPGVLLWRGFTLQQFAHQCFGNTNDFGKGRQMPIHYGSNKHNYFTVSSPIATQLPQAVGAAYSLKMDGKSACAVTFCGDGSTSEGDFHAAMNFAAVMEAPVVFICRNNGWAISTPVEEQFRSDGIVVKGQAYGIWSIRVDGNDALAVYSAVHTAREIAIKEQRPVLIEALTYRVGHHSTSDDSTKYRSTGEIEYWKMERNPVNRFKRWVERNGWWSEKDELELRSSVRKQVTIDIQVTAGFPIRQVILQEIKNYNASWIVLDRHLRRDMRYHLNKIPCKVALVKDDLSVDIWRSHNAHDTNVIATKPVFSLSKFVSLSDCHSMQEIEQSIVSCKSYPHSIASSDSSGAIKSYSTHSYANSSLHSGSSSKHERSGISIKGEYRHLITSQIGQKQNQRGFLPKSSDAPILCAGCGIRTELSIKESNKFNYSEIQLATNDFSKDNLIGEGGYGHVYKGVLKDGQQIAAKVRKEESAQGFSEFHSEVYVLSFARHKNIVMLLGYCCKENKNILIYEYICNKSLHWHLFENNDTVLDWPQRYGIALGTAKGLRFLHEECRGGPIIHRDMRPSNILLTHDFVPMLGDFGLAKWITGGDPLQTRIMGTLGYLAPEYAEDGIVSEGTDVYSYGVTLLQLISGRQVSNFNNPDHQQQSLRQWAEPMIEKLALQELIDPRLGESYDTYELYLMAKAANFCMQRKPEMRPSMREVVRFLEGESYHFSTLEDQFIPNHNT